MPVEPAPGRRPNILMIVTDQERADVLGCYGSALVRTPRVDAFAAQGVRFETCLAPAPICSPARASLLTGLYPHGHGILNNTHEPDALRWELPEELPTFSRLLRDAGYRLGYVGKWHVDRRGPWAHGFHDVADVHENIVAAPGEDAIVEAEPAVREPVFARYPRGRLLVAGIDTRPVEETETRRDADAAIGLLERFSDGDAPFHLRVDFEGPHHPYTPPERYAAMYEPDAIPPWPNFDESADIKPPAQQRLLEQRGVAGWTWLDWQPVVARYFGFVSFIDDEVGRILDALDRLRLADTTVVVVTGDHGDMTGSHGGQFNKGPLMYDEVLRIPLIVRDPRSTAHGVHRGIVGSLALMPTILELAAIARPSGLHAESLVPLLVTPDTDPGDGAGYAEYHGEEWGLYSQRMVRTAKAKYVYSPHGVDELYDLAADPHERHNVIADPAARMLLSELRTRLLDWMERTADPLALWAGRLF